MSKRLYERGIQMGANQIVYRNENVVLVSEFIDFGFNTENELIVLGNQMCCRFQIDAQNLILIEHIYNDHEEFYSEVEFSMMDNRFCNPRWKVVSKEYVDDMMTTNGYILK